VGDRTAVSFLLKKESDNFDQKLGRRTSKNLFLKRLYISMSYKPIGLLYDNWSGNTGDQAIGLSLKLLMKEFNFRYEEIQIENFDQNNYSVIIVGGGLLLRQTPNSTYDHYKVKGHHILNSMGIYQNPLDLNYLNDYQYVSVRSQGDQQIVGSLKIPVHVVPCTTLLLTDLNNFPIQPLSPSLCIHLLPGAFSDNRTEFIEWVKSLPYHIYFLPITHYNNDISYMQSFCANIPNAICYPKMTPMEIFTLLGKFTYVISCSLHGAIFAYKHNVPFTLLSPSHDRKMEFFMKDRHLESYLFTDLVSLKKSFELLTKSRPNYTDLIKKDLAVLDEHKLKIKTCLENSLQKGLTF